MALGQGLSTRPKEPHLRLVASTQQGSLYLSHFNLQGSPFKVSTDPKFLWLGEKQKEALEKLRQGILHGNGYAVLTGDVGTGKTTLAVALSKGLAGDFIVARVAYPDGEVLDFLKLIAAAFGIDGDVQNKASFRDRFGSFLRSRFAAGKRAVLILDEAQRMKPEHLEELLELSSVEENGLGLLTLVFAGQNEFNKLLREDSNRAIRQRIAVSYDLVPLTQSETGQYISRRLSVVHCQREIFTPDAIQEIYLYSKGIPRLINLVCDIALLITFWKGGETVQAGAVKRGVERLLLPGERSEWIATQADQSFVSEKKIRQLLSPKRKAKVHQRPIRGEGRKRAYGKLLWVGGLVFVAVLMGLPLLPGREGIPPQDRKVETSNGKRIPQDSASQVLMKSPKEPDVGGLSLPLSESPLLKPADTGLDSSAQKKASVGPKQTVPPQKASAPATRTGSQKAVGSGASSGPPPKAFAESRRNTQALPEVEKGLIKSMGQSPGPTTGSSVREIPEKETEEADPGKAIDWLLEKRGGR